MMAQQTQKTTAVKSVMNGYTGKTAENAFKFSVRQMLSSEVNTALPVVVTAVMPETESVGYVKVRPLVSHTDADGNILGMPEIPRLPYFRIQGGTVAVITDPVVGDKGLAIFSQSDCDNVTADTQDVVPPGSFRKFSLSDGFYIGGFLNKAPKTYVQLNQDGTTIINSTGGVTINGTVTVNGDVIADGISLKSHVHGGVMSGGSTTGGPR